MITATGLLTAPSENGGKDHEKAKLTVHKVFVNDTKNINFICSYVHTY